MANNKQNNNVSNSMGPYGPVVNTKTTIGVNTSRISNSRPQSLPAVVGGNNLHAFLSSESFQIGRHAFGLPTSDSLLPVDLVPNAMTKDANYVITNRGDHLISSQTVVNRKVSNGRSRMEISVPYYDAEALNTLKSSSQTFGAIAPMGSFKIGLDVHMGGIMTGTDAAAMLKADQFVIAALKDLLASYEAQATAQEPLFAASGYGVLRV